MDAITSFLEKKDHKNNCRLLSNHISELDTACSNMSFLHKHIGTYGITEEGMTFFNQGKELSNLLGMSEAQLLTSDIKVVQEGLLEKIKDTFKKKIAAWKERQKIKNDRNISENTVDSKKLKEAADKFKAVAASELMKKPLSQYPASYYKTKIDVLLKLFPIITGHNLIKKYEGLNWFDLKSIKKDVEFLIQCTLELNTSIAAPINWYLGWNEERKPNYETHLDRHRAKHGYKANSTYEELGWTPENIKHFYDQWIRLSEFVKSSVKFGDELIRLRSENIEAAKESFGEKEAHDKKSKDLIRAAYSSIDGVEHIFYMMCESVHQISEVLIHRMQGDASKPSSS